MNQAPEARVLSMLSMQDNSIVIEVTDISNYDDDNNSKINNNNNF